MTGWVSDSPQSTTSRVIDHGTKNSGSDLSLMPSFLLKNGLNDVRKAV
jgi:hypothetical protein